MLLAVIVDADDRIKVDEHITLMLNDRHQIVFEYTHLGLPTRAGLIGDPDALVRALHMMQLVQAERQATDTRPIDDPTRKALFASLREVFGELDRDERLAKLSAFAGHRITSLSDCHGNMTMADAHRVFDVLNAL